MTDQEPLSFTRLTLLWLAANSLRVTILSVPPLLPRIHAGLHLTESEVGILTSLPTLLLAAGAVPGSLLVARVGPRRGAVAGLVVVAAGGALRGLGDSAPVLFGMTFLMGLGIAASQPTLPTLVRLWFPRRTGLATAVYSNGFLTGEIAAAGLTGTVLLALTGSWEAALALPSAVVVVSALGILLWTPHVPRVGAPARWWPNWRDGTIWRLGLIFGGASLAYFTSNAFIPDYLKVTHHAADINAALVSLNLCQVPASFVIAAFAGRLIGRRWPLIVLGLCACGSVAGYSLPGIPLVAFAGVLGFCTASVFVLVLALPPLLAAPNDVHRFSSAIFTITYACPFAGSLIGGAAWDLTGRPLLAFLPVAAAGLLTVALAFDVRDRHPDIRTG